MTMWAGVPVLAAEADGLIDRWRDLGPTLWLVAGGAALAWAGLLGLLSALVDPRRVRPGPATLEVQGDETPAVVNLITTDWDMGHAAIPATLIDLAARRHVDIDLVGGRTFVQVRAHRAGRAGERPLTRYEDMVLGHVRRLAGHTPDGRVPAEALTTGPEETAKNWWKDFRGAVVADARARGLSRSRWSPAAKGLLVAAAAPVALAAALAVSTMPDDPDDPDDNPVSAGLAVGVVAFAGLAGVAGSRSGERDTPEGRAAAERWLGLRELLEEDPLFAEQPPAAVAIWDHLLAQGTALGVAHGVVRSLPLGSESEREAWSPVGGRWRVVRVRYPRSLPPGYGMHPGAVTALGLLQLAFGLPLLPMASSTASALRESLETGPFTDGTVSTELPAGVGIAITVVLAVVTVLAAALALRGAAMTLVGLVDLVTGRATVEGRVLRRRDRSTDKRVIWYLAVDDGTTDRVRAWRFRGHVPGRQGDTVRARVSRRLRHVADLEVVAPATAPDSVEAAPTAGATGAAPAGRAAAVSGVLSGLAGLAGPGAAEAAMAVVAALPGRGTGTAAPGPDGTGATGPTGTGTGPPPPALPDDAAVSAAAGRPMARDAGAPPHPAALAGGSAIYRGTDGHVQVVWVPAVTVDVYRTLPAAARHEVPGLGDEAYRSRFGGGVVARRGERVVMVTPHLPSLDAAGRDEVAVRVARAAIDRLASDEQPGPAALGVDGPHDT